MIIKSKSKKKETKKTFTKKWLDIILTLAEVDIQLAYILAYISIIMDLVQRNNANAWVAIIELTIVIVTQLLATVLGYFCKSFFETREEKRQRLKDFEAGFDERDLL